MTKNNLKNFHVLVTPTSFGKNDEMLKKTLEDQVGKVTYNTAGRPLTSLELAKQIQDVDGYIAGLDVIDKRALDSANKLKVIARYGVGVDNVDLSVARSKGIVITNTPGANSGSVAELAISLILLLARNLLPAILATQAGEWPRFSGYSLEGKLVGLIGFGNIGQQVARRLSGFGCKVQAFDLYPDRKAAELLGVQLVSKDEVITNSDYISLHCNLDPDTRHMLDKEAFRMMKEGVVIINTARGGLIDEQALLNALNENKVRAAALDVFSEQPPNPDDPLLNHPGVVVTPHMGAHTDGATNSMGWGATKNCLAVLGGENPLNWVGEVD